MYEDEDKAAAVAVSDRWAFDYVAALFLNRGYDTVTDADARRVLESQLPNWRRKLAAAGLATNEDRAADVAFHFAGVRVHGGAARIYEHFVEFLKERPWVESKPIDPAPRRGWTCQHCGGLGAIVVQVRNGAGRRKDAAFRCVCDSGNRYAGTPMADSDILAAGKAAQDDDHAVARFWYGQMGLNYDQDDEQTLLAGARQRFRAMFAEMRENGLGRKRSVRT